MQGRRNCGGGSWSDCPYPQILADMLSLSQYDGQIMPTTLLTSVPQKSIPSAVVYYSCAWYLSFSAEQTLLTLRILNPPTALICEE
jgi:hypothetical protein